MSPIWIDFQGHLNTFDNLIEETNWNQIFVSLSKPSGVEYG